MPEFEKDPLEIGALWERVSSAGKPYMTGTVEVNGVKQDIVLFQNSGKRSDKSPAWRILKSKPRERPAAPSADW